MKFRLAFLVLFAALFLTSCNFSLAEDITPPPNYKSPTPEPTLGALFPAEAPVPQEGFAIYMEKCAPCHGEQGRGDGPQGLQLNTTVPAFGLPSVGRKAIPTNYFTMVSQGRIEKFMPPFSGSLNETQRWNVVAYVLSLHTSAEELALGETLYEANCAECHGEDGALIAKSNLADQQFMAKRSEQDLFSAITDGVPGVMPAADKLTEDERWALAAYTRSLTFAELQPTATPQPSPTVAATESAPTPEATFILDATAEATSMPELDVTPVPTIIPNTTGAVTGSVVRATGGTLPAGMTVKLLGFDHGENTSAPQQVVDLSSDVQADGTYAFENIEIPEGRFYVTEVSYQGVPYQSDVAVVEKDATGLVLAPFTLYESTEDLSGLQVNQGHIIIQFDESRIGILELLALSNPTDKTIVFTTDGQTLPFVPMPEGTELMGFDLQQGEAPFVPTENGFAIPPSDKLYGAVTGFAVPYDKKAEISVPIGVAIPAFNVIAPQGVKIKSDQLTSQPADPQTQNQVFLSGPLNSGDQLTFEVSGSPKTEEEPATTTKDNTGLLIGAAALGIALMAAGVYLYLRDRKQRRDEDEDEDVDDEPAGESAEVIMDAIIALDDQYRSGNIAEDVYQKRRAELKSRLKDSL